MTNDNEDDERLDALENKLEAIRAKEKLESSREAERMKDGENMANGIRAGAELITPILAGGLIGWGLDNWLENKPAFLIIMLVLGVITGFFNVYRISMNMGSSVGFRELHQREKNATNAPAKTESDEES